MQSKLNLIPSGIDLIDDAWGGFYKGGTYITIGGRKSGKSMLCLQYAVECVKRKEKCLYFTGMRPKDITILAASINIDIETYMNNNELIVVKVSPPAELYETGDSDRLLVEYFDDIISVIDQYQPDRMIFDELTNFIGFDNLNLLQQTFLKTIESIEEKNITSLYSLAEPATDEAQSVIDSVTQYSTAVIYLQKPGPDADPNQGGRITITPNIGHTEGQFSGAYSVEPYKGLIFSYEPDDRFRVLQESEGEGSMITYADIKGKTGRINLKERKIPENFKPMNDVEFIPNLFTFTNFYEKPDFTLILNNQIALYKSTGQAFTLIILKLDDLADRSGLLTANQLKNIIRLSTEKKDKICIDGKNILILINETDDKVLNTVLTKIKNNLPSTDEKELNTMMNLIYFKRYVTDDSVENAEKIFEDLVDDN